MLLLLLGCCALLLLPRAAAAACGDGVWKPDMDCKGGAPAGFKPRNHLTLEECCQLCVQTPTCAQVTWNGPNGTWRDGGCNLKACTRHEPCQCRPEKGQFSCVVRPPPPPVPPPAPPPSNPDEDASGAWLRYRPVVPVSALQSYRTVIQRAAVAGPRSGPPLIGFSEDQQAQLKSAQQELTRGLTAMGVLDHGAAVACCAPSQPANGTLLVQVSPVQPHEEGFTIMNGAAGLVLQASTAGSALDAVFHLLQLMLRGEPLPEGPSIAHKPAMQLRIWDLWDNLNGDIERGFGGNSLIWPMALDAASWTNATGAAVENMARLLKSSGLNGVVLNNVNACGTNAKLLSRASLGNISATVYPILAAWGLMVYLTPCYAAPMMDNMGQPPLSSVDPLDPKVVAWWAIKATEIEQLMPSFNGFLVKADSEGNKGGQNPALVANVAITSTQDMQQPACLS